MTRRVRNSRPKEPDWPRSLLESIPAGILGYDGSNRIVLVNAAAEEIFGLSRREMEGLGIEALLPEYRRVDRGTEITVRRKDRAEIPVQATLAQAQTEDGLLTVLIVSDLTERRLSEQRERELRHQLVTVRDQERKRVARELHDDFVQRLVAIRMEIDLLWSELRASSTVLAVEPSPLAQRLRSLHDRVNLLARLVRDLSHDLYVPSVAESSGLIDALRRHCEAISKAGRIEVTCSVEPPAFPIREETALGLYRVAQEALQNAVKHSRAGRIGVRLKQVGGGIRLTVLDAGCGFEVAGSRKQSGLGLRSMEERVLALGGRISIRSRIGSGTCVRAWIPLDPRGKPGEPPPRPKTA